MQPCKTGDQPYSDASPNGECSLSYLFTLVPSDIEIFAKTGQSAMKPPRWNFAGI